MDVSSPSYESLQQWIVWSCDNSLLIPPSHDIRLYYIQDRPSVFIQTIPLLFSQSPVLPLAVLIPAHESCLFPSNNKPLLLICNLFKTAGSLRFLQGTAGSILASHLSLCIPKSLLYTYSAQRMIICLPNMLKYIHDLWECRKLLEQHSLWPCQALCIRDESAGQRRFIPPPPAAE